MKLIYMKIIRGLYIYIFYPYRNLKRLFVMLYFTSCVEYLMLTQRSLVLLLYSSILKFCEKM